MTVCRRNFTKEQIIEGLKAGRTFNVDRSDAPELEDLRELERQGLVTSKLKEIDDQSSVSEIQVEPMITPNHPRGPRTAGVQGVLAEINAPATHSMWQA